MAALVEAEDAAAVIGPRLAPPSPLPPARVARLLAELDDEDFAARQRVSQTLAEHLAWVTPGQRVARRSLRAPRDGLRGGLAHDGVKTRGWGRTNAGVPD